MSDPTSSPPPHGNPRAGKLVAMGLVLLVVGAVAVLGLIGYHHATRNKRRHGDQVLGGAELYKLYCQRCHAPDGRGERTYPALSRPGSLEEFTAQVKTGKDRMPAFAKTFREDEYPRLHEHVLGLFSGAR